MLHIKTVNLPFKLFFFVLSVIYIYMTTQQSCCLPKAVMLSSCNTRLHNEVFFCEVFFMLFTVPYSISGFFFLKMSKLSTVAWTGSTVFFCLFYNLQFFSRAPWLCMCMDSARNPTQGTIVLGKANGCWCLKYFNLILRRKKNCNHWWAIYLVVGLYLC